MVNAWTRLRAALNPVAQRFNAYTAYQLHGAEHIGTTHDVSLAGARYYLKQNAYQPQYLSAAKRHPTTRALHDLSYRRVPVNHPPEWGVTGFEPLECQYHVHAFAWDSGRIDWYSHYEVRPDVFDPSFSVHRLRTHYRPSPGNTYLRGVTNLQL